MKMTLNLAAALALVTGSALIAKPPVKTFSPPAAPAVTAPQVPPPETLLILIRSSVSALNQANLTNNYTVLNGLGSDSFRAKYPPAALAQIFSTYRANNIDMNPVVLINPQLSRQPVIEGGRLHLVGVFPSQPMQVNYDLTFEPSQGQWKLWGLSVYLSQPQVASAQTLTPNRP